VAAKYESPLMTVMGEMLGMGVTVPAVGIRTGSRLPVRTTVSYWDWFKT